ncbi:MAG TPA: uroporphyrinogen-III C-methyltransferase [Gemmatimonadaceae bacterium]|nr:uroporphyrinogen-III C-methyltransferase [Gemmatimonadaceae bacterium]
MPSTPDATGPAKPGIVFLVGAGPGDPGLITVRGRELLDDCDAIVHDALANPALVRRGAQGPELIDAGKRGGSTESARQEDINETLIRLARAGKRVVRLKGGDPFVFGRGSEEAQALARAGIPFEIVPGVTAGIAAPAYAGIPVTHRGIATSVTFVTGHEDPTKPSTTVDWDALARCAATGTVVLYMGVKTLPSISRALIAGGLSPDTPAAAVQWGTHPTQRTVVATVGTLPERAAEEGLTAPVISIIGHSVALRDEISWFEARPLFGRRVIVTRATATAGTLAGMLRARGADVIEAPSTEIEALDQAPIDEAVLNLRRYRWLILTSVTGVRFLGAALDRAGLDARALAGIRVAVIGPATAKALRELGVRPDVVPSRFVAESLLDAMGAEENVRGARVLFAGAEDARPIIPDGLRALGAVVDVVSTYRSRIVTTGPDVDSLREAIDSGRAGYVTFTSASSVGGFVAQVGGERARRVQAVSIGPVTSNAARAEGIPVVAEASEATIAALVEAVPAA